MPKAVYRDLHLYADDSCLVYIRKDKDIEANLNKDFNCLCDWFVENSIHFVVEVKRIIEAKRG